MFAAIESAHRRRPVHRDPSCLFFVFVGDSADKKEKGNNNIPKKHTYSLIKEPSKGTFHTENPFKQ